MAVTLKLSDGKSIILDRSLSVQSVATRVNDARSGTKLIEFPDNRTPSRTIYVDPRHVVTISDDGFRS